MNTRLSRFLVLGLLGLLFIPAIYAQSDAELAEEERAIVLEEQAIATLEAKLMERKNVLIARKAKYDKLVAEWNSLNETERSIAIKDVRRVTQRNVRVRETRTVQSSRSTIPLRRAQPQYSVASEPATNPRPSSQDIRKALAERLQNRNVTPAFQGSAPVATETTTERYVSPNLYLRRDEEFSTRWVRNADGGYVMERVHHSEI